MENICSNSKCLRLYHPLNLVTLPLCLKRLKIDEPVIHIGSAFHHKRKPMSLNVFPFCRPGSLQIKIFVALSHVWGSGAVATNDLNKSMCTKLHNLVSYPLVLICSRWVCRTLILTLRLKFLGEPTILAKNCSGCVVCLVVCFLFLPSLCISVELATLKRSKSQHGQLMPPLYRLRCQSRLKLAV